MSQRNIVVIAASRGGIKALCRLVSAFQTDFPGSLLAVQHTGSASPRTLPTILQRHTCLHVRYGRAGDVILRGQLYLAPPDRHLIVDSAGRLQLDDGPKANFMRPAADPLFASAAEYFGARVVGVVLTGRGHDGTKGLRAIKKQGGLSIVQHPAQAEESGMPMSALNGDAPDFAVSLQELGPLLYALAQGRDGHEYFS